MANTVEILNLSDNDNNDAPFEIEVEYVADQDGLEIFIEYSGYSVSPKDAPQSSGTRTFSLNWGGTTTNETVRAVLRVKASPTTQLDSDTRYSLVFDTGGPPV